MRNEILRELQAEYEEQRSRNTAEEERRRAEAARRCPEIGALADARQELVFSGLRDILAGKGTQGDVRQRMRVLNERITALLEENGYPRTWLDPVYRCPICKDRGYVGEPVREMCECMRRRMYDRLFREMGLEEAEPQTFERFDETIFSDAPLAQYGGMSQRDMMRMHRARCEQWADTFPDARTNTILLSGQSGLGKTYMLHAMAHRLLERGQNVLVISAYRFIELARKAHYTADISALDGVLDADVLMVDDLGSEPLIENVTIIQLFNLINERQTRRKGTVFSTNLSKKELRAHYTERIASRLLDTQTSYLVQFVGDDVRRR